MASEFWYPGASYPIESSYSKAFTGYSVSPYSLGLATDPRTANQLGEVSRRLNIGGTTIEAGAISADVMESIPEQHLDEIRRLSKLTNTDITFHAPIVEPSGFTKEGWSEANRQMTERQMLSAVERAKKLTKDQAIPVTFHSSAGLPEGLIRVKEEGKEKVKGMAVIDPMSGEVSMIKEKERFFPEAGEVEKKPFSPETELKRINEDAWLSTLNKLAFNADRGGEVLTHAKSIMTGAKGGLSDIDEEKLEKQMVKYYKLGKKMTNEEVQQWKDKGWKGEMGMMKDISRDFDHAQVFLMDSYNNLKGLYNRIYKEISDTAAKGKVEDKEQAKKDLEKLDAYAKEIVPLVKKGIERDPEKIQEFSDMIGKGLRVLKEDVKPKIYRPLDDFVIDNSAKTFGNVAWNVFAKAKPEERNKLPIISIENPPAGGGISRAEEIKKLIEASRDQFVRKAKEEGKMSESEAKKMAEKMIGATWDVGHINMLRKYGYDKADIVKQTEKIKPFLKHMHLSDNFGYEHTELPMGMGDVPLKEMLQKIGKTEGDIKKIMETGNWYQYFKTTPFKQVLEGVRAPIYGMKAPPYWSQAAQAMGAYSTGYGTIFPEQHFSMYGGGFSTLPVELGGQVQQKGSRFTGTPME